MARANGDCATAVGLLVLMAGTAAAVAAAGEKASAGGCGAVVGKAIMVGGQPGPIVIAPDGKIAYVANANSGSVTPIRVSTNTALAPIKAGGLESLPLVIVITPNGKMAYVARDSGKVVPIRVATNTALRAINVGQERTWNLFCLRARCTGTRVSAAFSRASGTAPPCSLIWTGSRWGRVSGISS